MSRILFLESVSGVAGDMFAAAFVDAGLVTAAELAAVPARLGWPAVRVEINAVTRAQMRATHLRVVDPSAAVESVAAPLDPAEQETHLVVDAPAPHQHTRHADIDRRLAKADLPEGVRARARGIFRLIAEAEAAAHGMAVGDVAFHEIGLADSVVDVVLAAWCVEKVRADRVIATPIRPGRGFVRMQHGRHPVPPPASARLLSGLPVAPVPAGIARENIELSTPTGIAILKALAPEFRDGWPAGVVCAQGLGAGTLDLGVFPNVFRVALLEDAGAPAAAALPYLTDRVIEVAANIDDDTGENIAWLAERLLAQGALDVWLTPATGKKGRPLTCLQFLAAEADFPRLADWFLRHSTTFGLRHRPWDRLKLERRFEARPGPLGPVTHKVGLTTTGEELKAKPEFEEVRRQRENPPGGQDG
ncbi:MAG: hypothetical protein RLZZ221_885 [Verrucomicrobiota bacterium]|jgi:uncharacterized protein (TIGR00299 family) protein